MYMTEDMILKEHNFVKVLAHAPYTLNPCSKDEKTREFALETMADDLRRMEYIPGNMYNFHPGSHTGQGSEEGIKQIAFALNSILTEDIHTTVLLETMAGKGTEVGRNFQEIRDIIDSVNLNEKLGVCLDTCHVHDGGYDILETMAGKGTEVGRNFQEIRDIIDSVNLNEKLGVCLDTCHVHDGGYDIVNDIDGVLDEFDKIIGLERLCAIHLNDSMNVCGSHKDRHQKIGEGEIGLEAIEKIINNPRLKGIPFYLETPNDIDGYKREIALLKSIYKEWLYEKRKNAVGQNSWQNIRYD